MVFFSIGVGDVGGVGDAGGVGDVGEWIPTDRFCFDFDERVGILPFPEICCPAILVRRLLPHFKRMVTTDNLSELKPMGGGGRRV